MTYIALDLETTGFNADSDQIIEIAALKFEEGKMIERFETLINPQIQVPPFITHITGIKNEDVVEAPKLPEIQSKLLEFLGNHPIVGHNIDFDVTFLKQKGLPLQNPLYDTLPLAMILFPGLPSYSLDTLTRLFKITHENKHRAMSDTQACFELFLLLEEKICQIDPAVYQEISKILIKSDWALKELFHAKCGNLPINPPAPKVEQKVEKSLPPLEITEELLGSFYEKLGRVRSNFQKKPEQILLSQKIFEALKNNRNLLVEAGTGTGKTFAYLLSSVLFALQQKEKVLLACCSQNLQDQILTNELPLLRNVLQDMNFQMVLLKQRHQYISLQRLEAFQKKEFFLDHEVTFLIKVFLWLSKTETGDMDELSLHGKEFSLLDDVGCSEYACSAEQNGCYFQKALQAAKRADVVLIHPGLLVKDDVSPSFHLADFHYLLIDEAHELEKIVTDELTLRLALNSFQRPFFKIKELLQQNQNDVSLEIKMKIDQLVPRIEIFFGLLGIFFEKNLPSYEGQFHLALKGSDFSSPEWHKIETSAQVIIEVGSEIVQAFENVTGLELKENIHRCQKYLDRLKALMQDEGREHRILWLTKSFEESMMLHMAPLNLKDAMAAIFQPKKSVILLSATLKADETFHYIRDQLHLENFDELTVAPHFDHPEHIKIVIPKDLPLPATEGYFSRCNQFISSQIIKNKGKTLVLFTSKKAMAATYHEIAPPLKEQGFTLLAQKITGGRGKILEHFKDEPENSAILALQNFWDEVEFLDDDLECVIILKLPFDPPSDPIIQARSQKYQDSFSEYLIPRAILSFRKSLAKLIRSSKKKGSIIILDGRILQKNYGGKFLSCLPAEIKLV
jgi:predicted DnaQ family exonuclease/DinG family helicase